MVILLALALVVLIHEFGHFSVAKFFGVPCPIFSLGMGPRLFGFMYKGTDFRLSLLPLGGYVKISGFNDSNSGSDSYRTKPRWQRFLIVAAGPGINILSVLIGYALVLNIYGMEQPTNQLAQVGAIRPELESALILKPGDIITAVNGKKVISAQEIEAELIMLPGNEEVKLTITRNGNIENLNLGKERIHLMSFVSKNEKLGLTESFYGSAYNAYSLMAINYRAIKKMLSGNKELAGQMRGPVGIVEMGFTVQVSPIWYVSVAFWAYILSLGLGFMNLIPIPPLDGGWMAILLLESVSRRDFNEKLKRCLIYVGFLMIICLFLYITTNDILRIVFK